MKNITEMTAAELSACIGRIAGPAQRIYSDRATIDALEAFRERMPEKVTAETAMSLFVTTVYPVLTGKEHKKDAYAILEALCEGEKTENRNGLEVMRDLFVIFVKDREVEAIFRPGVEARGE